MAVLPPPSGAAPGLSKYRRRRLAAAETLVEPQGEVPLENVPLELKYTELAERQMDEFDADGSKRGVKRQLEKALLHLAANQKHPGLNSHRFNRSDGTWISYVQNGTGANYRLIWRYVPRQRCIQVERITPHT
jgi:mRNA-degrading endonuclease YafQ of YafQ-DinJ toxin-antitoxin module